MKLVQLLASAVCWGLPVLASVASNSSSSSSSDSNEAAPTDAALNFTQQADASLFKQPRNMTVNPRPNAHAEAWRLRQWMEWSDLHATGFFLNPDTPLEINVSGLPERRGVWVVLGPADLVHPKQKSLNTRSTFSKSMILREGQNTVSDKQGGILYISYGYMDEDNKPPPLTVRLGDAAQPFPFFQQSSPISREEWLSALRQTTVPFAEVDGDKVIITGLAKTAEQYCTNPAFDFESLLGAYEQIIRAQDEISGLDPQSPDLKDRPSPLRPFVVEANTGVYGNAATPRAAIGTNTTYDMWLPWELEMSWKMWHELGHQRQHGNTWSWDDLTEVTVNIYSLAARRTWSEVPNEFQEHGTQEEWQKARAWLDKPVDQKKFDEADVMVKLVMFEQMRLAFGGDAFYHKLHRASRRRDLIPHAREQQIWFMAESSRIAGKDLTDYFVAWGLTPTNRARQMMGQYPGLDKDYTQVPVYQETKTGGQEAKTEGQEAKKEPESKTKEKSKTEQEAKMEQEAKP